MSNRFHLFLFQLFALAICSRGVFSQNGDCMWVDPVTGIFYDLTALRNNQQDYHIPKGSTPLVVRSFLVVFGLIYNQTMIIVLYFSFRSGTCTWICVARWSSKSALLALRVASNGILPKGLQDELLWDLGRRTLTILVLAVSLLLLLTGFLSFSLGE